MRCLETWIPLRKAPKRSVRVKWITCCQDAHES
jgi:hypothetical protein